MGTEMMGPHNDPVRSVRARVPMGASQDGHSEPSSQIGGPLGVIQIWGQNQVTSQASGPQSWALSFPSKSQAPLFPGPARGSMVKGLGMRPHLEIGSLQKESS